MLAYALWQAQQRNEAIQALRRLIDDELLRGRLAEVAWTAGQNLPRWSDTAALIAQTIKEARR